MRASPRSIPLPDSFNRQTPSIISLGQIRSGPQTTNEYVETPRVPSPQSFKSQIAPVGGTSANTPSLANRTIPPSRSGGGNSSGPPRPTVTPTSSPVVSQQPLPKSPPLKKDLVNSLDESRGGDGTVSANGGTPATSGAKHGEGIICDQCGKCRCTACTERRKLPSYWCCKDTCEISADKVLDVCTCFCCVKGMFYHCGAEEDNECYESPCGCCSTPNCCQRWVVLTMMAICLPCLWMYWPAKGCLAGCASCYNRFRHKGCQCNVGQRKCGSVLSVAGSGKGCTSVNGGAEECSKHSPTRRLLIESDSSSA